MGREWEAQVMAETAGEGGVGEGIPDGGETQEIWGCSWKGQPEFLKSPGVRSVLPFPESSGNTAL